MFRLSKNQLTFLYFFDEDSLAIWIFRTKTANSGLRKIISRFSGDFCGWFLGFCLQIFFCVDGSCCFIWDFYWFLDGISSEVEWILAFCRRLYNYIERSFGSFWVLNLDVWNLGKKPWFKSVKFFLKKFVATTIYWV